LFDVNGVSQGLPERAMDVGDRGRCQSPAITAAMLGQVSVELGNDGWAEGLQPHPADAGHDVVINVVAVSGESFGLHRRSVCL